MVAGSRTVDNGSPAVPAIVDLSTGRLRPASTRAPCPPRFSTARIRQIFFGIVLTSDRPGVRIVK